MTWWQIALTVVLNVPWLAVFTICVIIPSIKSAKEAFDKERFLSAFGGIVAAVAALSTACLFLFLFIPLFTTETFEPLVLFTSGGLLLISIIVLHLLSTRR